MSDSEEIMGVIRELFEAAVTNDMQALRRAYLDDPRFSSFGDLPPFEIRDYQSAMLLEELKLASISDYSYEIQSPKISVFGDAAVVALRLSQSGMLVDNKAFTGKHIKTDGRATFVLVRDPAWKIVHSHISRHG